MSDQIEEVSEPDETQWGLWGKRDDMIVHESDRTTRSRPVPC